MKGLYQSILSSSASDWKISNLAAQAIFWIPVFGALFLILARFYKPIFRFILHEDGPVEWMQFFAYLIAMVFSILIAIQRFRSGHRRQGLIFIGLVMLLIFICGEEISWGQRLLGLETPEELETINNQGELNLHNIIGILDEFNLAMMIAGAVASTGFLWNRILRLDRFGDKANFLFVPPFFLASAFFIIFSYKFVRFTILPQTGFTIERFGEWAEFCLAYGVFFFTGLNYRLLAIEAREKSIATSAVQDQPLVHQKI